ncbi:MAG: thiamine diphosphokinase [bacterium]|jgi:thiamine pyrophosphokinase
MKTVVTAAGGQVDDFIRPYLKQADLLIAADGGAEPLLNLGFVPQVVIGDFDSLSPGTAAKLRQERCKLIQVKREKDETDTELAVSHALAQGADDITLLGALGGRIDHTLANLILLASLAQKGITAKAVSPPLTVYAVTKNLTLKGTTGDLVSVFPFQGPASGVTETGFKYPLDDAYLDPFAVVGISNELSGCQGVIQVKEGVLLVFHYS